MDRFILSNCNIRVPRIIYGTAWKKDATEKLVRLALQNGFRGIDTACQPKHYHEAGVGAGVAASLRKDGLTRADLYIQTKFTALAGQDPNRTPYDPKAPLETQVAQSIATSLKNLQTDYLDCVLLHSPMSTMAQHGSSASPRAMPLLFRISTHRCAPTCSGTDGSPRTGVLRLAQGTFPAASHLTTRVKCRP
jgi:diketogulonate reductase-like aldo/keto reductase